jgi:putative N-acetylmannosamine-6-phosphate epimerase
MAMDKDEHELFERMTKAQERLANAVEKQQPGKVTQFLTMFAAAATVGSFFTVIDLIIKWFTGG